MLSSPAKLDSDVPSNLDATEMSVQIERILYASDDGSYGVALAVEDLTHEQVKLTGAVSTMGVGEMIDVTGSWSRHPKYGYSFKVASYAVATTMGRSAMIQYLTTYLNGVGEKRAAAIIDTFGDETLNVLDSDPDRLKAIPGCSKVTLDAKWVELRSRRRVELFLLERGMTAAMAARVYSEWGPSTESMLADNPYKLTAIKGIGWKFADHFALSLNIPMNAPARVDAGIYHALMESESRGIDAGQDENGKNERLQGGNCFLPLSMLIRISRNLLEIDDRELILQRIQESARSGQLVIEADSNGQDRVFRRSTYDREVRVADKIKALLEIAPQRHVSLEDVQSVTSEFEPTLEQTAAILAALNNRMSVLTGGPGSGKTASVRYLCDVLAAMDQSVILCAPTGKAAKRISEATGRDAKTIHRTLRYSPEINGFEYNEDCPLDVDLVVVDETSMMSLWLADCLFRAIDPSRTAVVFVGDIDQLPPVGSGKVLHDIIDSRAVPVTRLTKVFRQAARSMIIQAAYAINQGKAPELKPAVVAEKTGIVESELIHDYFFARREDNEAILAETIRIVTQGLPRTYKLDPMNDIQVIVPQRTGPVGVTRVNEMLQERLNPQGEKIAGGAFRVWDKLLCTRNDYDNDIMNGEFAQIVEYDRSRRIAVLNVDGRNVTIGDGDLSGQFQLAYAVTCHKMQGSSAKAVVIPLTTSFFTMLSRSMLYTAVTRAEEKCVLVGQPQALAISIGTVDQAKRNSSLATRIAMPTDTGSLV